MNGLEIILTNHARDNNIMVVTVMVVRGGRYGNKI